MMSLDCFNCLNPCNISEVMCFSDNKAVNTLVNIIIIVLSACGLTLLIAGALCTYTTVKLSSGVNCESVYVAGLLISAFVVIIFLFVLIGCLTNYGFNNLQNVPRTQTVKQGKLNQDKVTKYKRSPLTVAVV